MIVVSLIITILYLLLIGSFVFGFDKIKLFILQDTAPKTKFSVIIPFRNEADNLPGLLKSIESLNYPKELFEVFLVDDASEDDSVEIIHKVLDTIPTTIGITRTYIKIIPNKRVTNSPKKDAITTAINYAKHEWIITTDADCVFPKYWLDSFDEFIQKNKAVCIVGPIILSQQNNFLGRFQLLDILSLQGATIGGFGIRQPFMCNGANLAYTKAVFNQVNGFDGNESIASGDDIFLLEKIAKKHPKKLHYLKCENSIVTTKPQPSWSELTSQRIRWAGKASAYNNWFGKFTGLVVLLMNSLVIVGLLLSIIGVLNFKIWCYVLIIKFNIDFFLIYKSASFFNQKETLLSFIPSFFIYLFFSVYIAFISFFLSYKWKGRTFNK
ncbi:glycosyltransferase [Sabulilitoribacter multivorans]|uniref:Glycosyltransferase n=1 Tax=Flaviramulus multivorans TaxID=1304750 RepID=A0ABS9IH97_9FLAO|nr:glycosyltransferase [Flaviramulus multivorans]MCF7559938.1 glycosyltransferase [Flaviramulus multivorans]